MYIDWGQLRCERLSNSWSSLRFSQTGIFLKVLFDQLCDALERKSRKHLPHVCTKIPVKENQIPITQKWKLPINSKRNLGKTRFKSLWGYDAIERSSSAERSGFYGVFLLHFPPHAVWKFLTSRTNGSSQHIIILVKVDTGTCSSRARNEERKKKSNKHCCPATTNIVWVDELGFCSSHAKLLFREHIWWWMSLYIYLQ